MENSFDTQGSNSPKTSTPVASDPRGRSTDSLSKEELTISDVHETVSPVYLNQTGIDYNITANNASICFSQVNPLRVESAASFNSVTLDTNEDTEDSDNERVSVPIVGFEVQERKSKFTVFKLEVNKDGDLWCIFRRYTDFVRLNDKLGSIFPHFRLSLPPKRWFKDNFEKDFLEDRLLGLQAFVNNIIGHKDLKNCEIVRQFFCLDQPPSPFDTLEGSKAICESLEERCYDLQRENEEKDHVISLLQEELEIVKTELHQLKKKNSGTDQTVTNCQGSQTDTPTDSTQSLTEQFIHNSCNADQSSTSGNIDIK